MPEKEGLDKDIDSVRATYTNGNDMSHGSSTSVHISFACARRISGEFSILLWPYNSNGPRAENENMRCGYKFFGLSLIGCYFTTLGGSKWVYEKV